MRQDDTHFTIRIPRFDGRKVFTFNGLMLVLALLAFIDVQTGYGLVTAGLMVQVLAVCAVGNIALRFVTRVPLPPRLFSKARYEYRELPVEVSIDPSVLGIDPGSEGGDEAASDKDMWNGIVKQWREGKGRKVAEAWSAAGHDDANRLNAANIQTYLDELNAQRSAKEQIAEDLATRGVSSPGWLRKEELPDLPEDDEAQPTTH